MTNEYAIFASRYGITTEQAHVLPALFSKAAQDIGRSERGLLTTAIERAEVGEYMASCARQVAAECPR